MSATVAGTVARRGGKARAIRNQGPPDAHPRGSQANPRAPHSNVALRPSAAPDPKARPAHLRLVTSQGSMVDPHFRPGAPVWVAGAGVLEKGEGQPERRETGAATRGERPAGRPAQRDAGAAAKGQLPAGRPARRGEGAVGNGQGRPARRGGRVAESGRVRLTRRGRLVITGTVVMLMVVASMMLASAAHAGIHL